MPSLPIVTWLATIPRPIAGLAIAAIYGAAVRWRFSWPMLLDAALLSLLLYRPSIGLAAWVGMLLIVRHTPTLAADVALLLRLDSFDGWTARALLFTLPALRAYVPLMSNAGDDQPGREDARTSADDGSPGSDDPVRGHQYQVEPDLASVREPEREPASLHRMSRAEEIAMLTVQRNDDGGYRHSANKIAELMGGTAADVKGQVAAIRGPAKPAQPPASARAVRPANGWGNKA